MLEKKSDKNVLFKILKSLLKKFGWPLFFLFLLTFLNSYFSFLIRFNLKNNLSFNNTRGKFYYLFGEYSVSQGMRDNGTVYVNWGKLLSILFLLYFPIKIIIQFAINYFQKYYTRKAQVYLAKKLLSFSSKNKDLIVKNSSEKVYVLNEVVPRFSQQFFAVPLSLFGIITGICLEIFSLHFLIQTRNLNDLIPLIISFVLVNLLWFVLFNYFSKKLQIKNDQRKINYQQNEKIQIRNFLESLNSTDSKTRDLASLYRLLDNNSQKMFLLNFADFLFSLSDLIIPGFSILFLFLYYQIYLGGESGLGWNEYFIANNLQSIFLKLKKGFNLLPIISSFCNNYQKVRSFGD